jgi:hypothetical protein
MEAKKIMLLKRLFRRVRSMDSKKATIFMEEHTEGAKLVPLSELGDSLNELDPAKPVIVY